MPRRPPLEEVDDQALVAAANRGEHAAFEALYLRHRDWAVGLAYRFTGNREDALDVLQEAFSYFWGKFPGFTLQSTVRSFLYPAIRNRSLDLLRRRSKENFTKTQSPEPVSMPGGGSDFEDRIAGLGDRLREVVRMRFVREMKLDEIAAALGVPVGTVKSRLHNALRQLRDTRKDYSGRE